MRRLLNRPRAAVQWKIPSADEIACFFNACFEVVKGALLSVCLSFQSLERGIPEKFFNHDLRFCYLEILGLRVVSQLKFDGVRMEIVLLLQIGLIIFTNIVVHEGNRNNQRNIRLAVETDNFQEFSFFIRG